jgi:hypothetical protein
MHTVGALVDQHRDRSVGARIRNVLHHFGSEQEFDCLDACASLRA